MTKIQVPKFYNRIYEITKQLTDQTDISNVLEIGCKWGHFVKLLREQGYNAFGIDLQGKDFIKEGVRDGYLFRSPVVDIKEVFGDNSFDLILANRTMSKDSQRATLLELDEGGRLVDEGGRLDWEMLSDMVESDGKANVESILRYSYDQLGPGKFFVAVEIGPRDTLFFSRECAEGIGYKVIKYEPPNKPQEAILQKKA